MFLPNAQVGPYSQACCHQIVFRVCLPLLLPSLSLAEDTALLLCWHSSQMQKMPCICIALSDVILMRSSICRVKDRRSRQHDIHFERLPYSWTYPSKLHHPFTLRIGPNAITALFSGLSINCFLAAEHDACQRASSICASCLDIIQISYADSFEAWSFCGCRVMLFALQMAGK